MKTLITILFLTSLALYGCTSEAITKNPAGKLYIIGGGSRPEAMLNEIIDLAGVRDNGYMYVLPMSSEEPDSAIIWTRESFAVTGFTSVYGYNFHNSREIPAEKLDSVRNAKLIYIPGGVQSRFMEAVKGTPVAEAIHEAYRNGALIAGTSAGAAVMSTKMITGDLLKPQTSREGYTTIEAGNIDIAEGLGLLPDVIVDQHFIKRQRLNRLVAAAIENPDQLCAGIDESTAIIVEGDFATVTGLSQVVVIRNSRKEKTVLNGLLGSQGMELSVYLPGEKFRIR
jgi:cyanophycinase